MTLGTLPESKVPREDELERDEKFISGRVIVAAVDHGPNSHAAFAWALDQFVTHADTVHLLHVLSKSGGGPGTSGGSDNSPMYGAAEVLFERLTKEAHEKKCNVRIVTLLKSGEPGKEIVAEATRSKAVAVIMGCRGLGTFKSLLMLVCIFSSLMVLKLVWQITLDSSLSISMPIDIGSDEDHHNSLCNSASGLACFRFDADPSIPAADDKEEHEEGLMLDGR